MLSLNLDIISLSTPHLHTPARLHASSSHQPHQTAAQRTPQPGPASTSQQPRHGIRQHATNGATCLSLTPHARSRAKQRSLLAPNEQVRPRLLIASAPRSIGAASLVRRAHGRMVAWPHGRHSPPKEASHRPEPRAGISSLCTVALTGSSMEACPKLSLELTEARLPAALELERAGVENKLALARNVPRFRRKRETTACSDTCRAGTSTLFPPALLALPAPALPLLFYTSILPRHLSCFMVDLSVRSAGLAPPRLFPSSDPQPSCIEQHWTLHAPAPAPGAKQRTLSIWVQISGLFILYILSILPPSYSYSYAYPASLFTTLCLSSTSYSFPHTRTGS